MSDVPYVRDILSQPEALESALHAFEPASLEAARVRLKQGRYDRIVVTGMGASYYAGYPVWQIFSRAGLAAIWVDAAELIHDVHGLVTPRTLLWITSQSGSSVEITAALDGTKLNKPGTLLATVNDLQSPLAESADYCIPIRAAPEQTVSTRTYMNSLALGQLAALTLLGKDVEQARRELLVTAAAMKTYVEGWEKAKQRIIDQLGLPKHLVLLGRGVSLCSAFSGALVLSEAAKYLATPFEVAEFRHGPLETASPDLTALIFEGPAETRELNLRMLQELRATGAKAFWIGPSPQEWQIAIPAVPAIGLPLVEMLPIQALSVHLAEAIGVRPGDFFRIGKVTLTE
jgi:glucosamine--fructose-6-phosphate aminotransferase (isomerizing)